MRHNIQNAADAPRDARRRAADLASLGLRANRALDSNQTGCDPELMTHAAKKLLDEFEALPDDIRAEIVAELVRRVAFAPHDLPTDTDLVAAADHLFLELDRREQPQ